MIYSLGSTAATAIGVVRKSSNVIPEVNSPIIDIASVISLNRRSGDDLKDKNRLALCVLAHFADQQRPVCQIGLYAEDIREPVFKVYPAKQ